MIPDIHGWPADKVQALQQAATQTLGLPVIFSDHGWTMRWTEKVRTGQHLVRKRLWLFGEDEYEPVFEDRQMSENVVPPEMVIIPAGSFLMGSPDSEPRRMKYEGPQHRVTIRPFALARTQVTFAQYDVFATATGRERPGDYDMGRAERPVIWVSWDDAVAYCRWLGKHTGKHYRLPTEAEWEYACRAGTVTPFNTGDCIDTYLANYDGTYYDNDRFGGRTGVYLKKTEPVASYPPNPWGLHDMHGNVLEWTEDCWNDNYEGAPSDGSAWRHGDCERRVQRGGAYLFNAGAQRSADRLRMPHAESCCYSGFRVARTLTP